jgi:hypothetical protein
MRTLFALGLFLSFFATTLSAQRVGEEWTDRRGLVLQFSDGHSLNLRIEENRLRMVFFDGSGLVEAPLFAKVVVRLDIPEGGRKDLTIVLRAAEDGAAMASPRVLRPPHVYLATILLYPSEDSDEGRIVLPQVPFRW